MALPRVPTSEIHQMRGLWREGGGRRGRWGVAPGGGIGGSEPVISGERELFTLPGPEGYPAALILLDHADRSMRVLRAGPAYAARYPDGPQLAALLEVSRKADHDELQELKRVRSGLIATFLAQGLGEGEAILRADRELRDLGFYPKPRRWVATALGSTEAAAYAALPRLQVDEMEIKVGLLSDIAGAMAAPGTEVDKNFGRYHRHRDYDSGEKLDALLEAGVSELLVERAGRLYHLRLLPDAPASRGPGAPRR
jgi:hypothetical protein